jgi:Short C-terminal domain
VILYGFFFLIAAWLASPHRSAVATRRAITPALRDYPVWVWSAFAVIAIVYVLSGVDSMRAVLTRVILLALAGAGIYELRRSSIAEFPDARMSDLPNRIQARFSAMWSGSERAAPHPDDRRLERLERLAALHERGALSDEEFASEKAALTGGERRDA